MNSFPTLTDIEIAWRKSKTGVCVIVEGQTDLDDPWFYNQWFGGDARRFTFFPQDGWEKVIEAVTQLRLTVGQHHVYGIVDRDFEPNLSYVPFPSNGILRTRKYTLENYLLNPAYWYEYIRPFTTRYPKPEWDSIDKVRQRIEEYYRMCLPLSAYNWTLQQASSQNSTTRWASMGVLTQFY
jgi:hypothetical protein